MKVRIIVAAFCAGALMYLRFAAGTADHPLKGVYHKGDSIPPEPWFKAITIYNLDIKMFKDSNGDGLGDIKGLISKLDYLRMLGVNVIWLAPFQPSPDKDDGYDVSDYYGIDRRLGSWEDLEALVHEATKRHLKLIMDLVLNHSSDENPWFKRSRDPASPFHSWYSWSKQRPANYNKGMGFPGVEKEIWSYDSVADAYYYHRFYKFQPDLNTNDPEVQKEVRKIIRFWLKKGFAGFRIDAVPFFIEVPQTKGKKFERRPQILTSMKQLIDSIDPGALFLGEINVPPKEDAQYFGGIGERMNAIFNFFVNQHIFYALASGNTVSLKKALQQTRNAPPNAAWGQFLRNHDEVDLGRLGWWRRKKVYQAFGPEPSMQLYHRGIRRRLAPMLKDRKKTELAYSLLFSLPSIPVLRYGEELGMGDDLSLKERLSVRTPMQWSDAAAAGFTSGVPVRPVIDQGAYSYKYINVQQQLQDTASLLRYIQHLIALRRSLPELCYGSWKILRTSSHLLAMCYVWQNKKILIVHNFSSTPRIFPVSDSLLPVFGSANSCFSSHHRLLHLPAYAYQWFRVKTPGQHSTKEIPHRKSR